MIYFKGCMIIIFFVLGTLLLVEAKPLHHQMTEKEIEKFFGVKASADVPEYEISEPYQSNEHGEFVSHTLHPRNTRGIHNSGTWFYKIDAFGNKMRLKLTRNTQLVKLGLELETRSENGDVTATPVKTDSLFHGREISDPGSLVAVSNDGGLTGMIKLSSETLFVHPLPDHLAKHVTTTRTGSKPHLVYRKSSEKLHCETKSHESDAALNLVANDIQNDVNSDSYNPPAHKYLQAALVADENVVAKHGNHTADFLLILANIVAGTYRDNSIGKIKVNYVVSRLIFITNKELNVTADSTNYEKLGKIRGWAYKNKPQDTNDPLYFDDISLVHVGHGGGLALAGGMCSYRVTGNVNAYRGLQTAGIIAHETAHNIGVGHDDGYTNCSDGVNIMSTGLPGGEGALKWSPCSQAVLQQFFSGPGSKCLDDSPQITLPAFNNTDMSDTLPGVLYDGDTQCEFQYGAGYKRCFLDNCVRLFCNKPGTSYCSSIFAPPADGTSCGTHKWCIKGKCVDNGLPRIHGGWSEWSADYSPCSATCGGGVQYRHRTCTNPPPKNNGDDCLGSTKGKWKICNSQTECPLPSARDLLCNKVQPGTSAYYSGDPCKLRCITPGSMLYFHGTVPDGFRCTNRPEILDVCTEGKCMAVGCDHVLESAKKRDRCEVCGGNGETCVFENSSYTQAAWNYGFDKENLIVVLPMGTTNAKFKQRKIGYNMLGIKDHLTGQYLIKLPSWSRAVYYKGSRIEYKHDDNRFADSIVVDGPTKVPLRMTFIYLYEKNQGVDYQYYRPLKSGEAVQHVNSKWATGEWSVCSAKCGQGFITRDVSCVRSDDGTPASAQSCSSIIKPRSRKTCKTQDCIPEWHLTNWNDCSKSCGNGSHSRQLYCRRKFNESYYEILDESSCNGTARPASGALFQRCNEIPCPPEWRTSPWSLCSKTCGGGLMTRKLECIRTDELGHVIPAAKELCRYAVKPLTETVCNDDKPCDPPTAIQVACFAGADNLEEVLGDFTNEIQWDITNEVVKKCAKLAHAKGYKLFALGKDGLCLSGPHTLHRYYIRGTDGADCKDGIGMGNSIFVYALDHVPSLQALGCYHDSYHDRAMSDPYANFRSQIIWTKMNLTVKQCARVAYDKGYEYFAIQFYGECWGGQDVDKNYAKHGASDGCWVFDSQTGHGVGGDLTNFVYRINKDIKTTA